MCTVSLLTWSIICAVSFEFARIFKAYDYRTFFMKLLGKFWFLYEICYFGILLIVLAVIAATAGSILQELFGLNYWIGVMGMMIGVGLLVFNGNEAIEKFLSYWSFLLYAVYIIFLIFSFTQFGLIGLIAKGYGSMTWGFFLFFVVPVLTIGIWKIVRQSKENINI